MASSVLSLDQLLTVEAIEGFSLTAVPLKAFCKTNVSGRNLGLSDQVRFPYFQNTSGSRTMDHSSGFSKTALTNQATGKTATLSNWLYQPVIITDSDYVKIGQSGWQAEINMAARRLASSVVSASFAVVTEANYPTVSNFSASAATGSNNPLIADLYKTAIDNKWPTEPFSRTLVGNSTIFANLAQNPAFNWQSLGTGEFQQTGVLASTLGFVPYVTNLSFPGIDNGFAIHPNAMGVALATPAPANVANNGLFVY